MARSVVRSPEKYARTGFFNLGRHWQSSKTCFRKPAGQATKRRWLVDNTATAHRHRDDMAAGLAVDEATKDVRRHNRGTPGGRGPWPPPTGRPQGPGLCRRRSGWPQQTAATWTVFKEHTSVGRHTNGGAFIGRGQTPNALRASTNSVSATANGPSHSSSRADRTCYASPASSAIHPDAHDNDTIVDVPDEV
ncbi:uncharacterized protein LOC121836839 [Ixodes scapularis]|uniref:uncharacterized protein LOC121836839 n=1 Tax=Ixodes scapularis TaxID=6945 RepID=UPI001A9FF3C0|nr:uncharacterized protein LOC121836839 [Ixodes scapularis]